MKNIDYNEMEEYENNIGAETLNKIAVESMHNQANNEWITSNGIIASRLNSEDFHTFVHSELEKWKKVVTEAGVKVE